MKLLVGHIDGKSAVYAVKGEAAKNLTRLMPEVGGDLMQLIANPALLAGLSFDGIAGEEIAVSQITPALPVANPGKIICLGLNYIDHIKEGGYEVPDYPALFMRSLDSLMPAGAPMVRPSCSEKLDYEVELMLIVGKGGRHIAEQEALGHVFGYTVFNDGSVRDYQRKTHQWTPGKNFDQTGAVGPFVVTPDELPEGATGLKIESRVGDEILQSASTSDMMWSVARTISTISEYTTLRAGDLIAMGTPPGVGHAKKPPRWLRPGEVVEAEVEGIGICYSPVVDEKDLSTDGRAS
ncbi:fumarylacetoacetate hydrolase family protein [Cohaesibacter celericrescens]|uniref:5-oxopent-3-ene-1,2,5-tricarboxylate decarboxylase n=1 Tax=Cohaesibacter celericrescens TaxID=2067669 RepID=A0A2N5XWU1_9HYPH|nr:fumarylacetoacetate hydrolase family protein [Cohaesibacter celericrescens]PLW78984.1 5-oxopent-3-ene-1,2,5-tricarboxylate decarboxylase [Cohaesibacter celericrescens]